MTAFDTAWDLAKEDCYWCDKDLMSAGVRQNYLMNRGTNRFPPPCPECKLVMTEGPPDKITIGGHEQKNPIFTTGEPIAFDTAWDLMKAPLDVDSIDYDPTHSDIKKPIAYFDDPVSGERVPMFSRKFGNQYIRMGDRDNPRADAKLDTGGRTIGEEHTHANIHPKVNEEYRERGYATAMYDLVAHLLQQAGTGGKLFPFSVQSSEAKEMWQNKQLGGREIHSELDPIGSGFIITDWPENLYWRPTV